MSYVTKSMQELTDKDMVLGTDNKWHHIKVLPIQGKKMFMVKTEVGEVEASHDHLWTIFSKLGKRKTVPTSKLKKYISWHIGIKNGPKLLDIVNNGTALCRCIQVDSPDHQFKILTNQGKELFTHNCAGRVICGRLGSTASLMALNNSLATTIDGAHKGRGIVSVNGEISNIQYYFTPISWIEEWWQDRGFDKNGYLPNEKKHIVEELSGEETVELEQDKTTFEFDDVKKEVDKTLDQVFEEI